jgi:hypothetical protein
LLWMQAVLFCSGNLPQATRSFEGGSSTVRISRRRPWFGISRALRCPAGPIGYPSRRMDRLWSICSVLYDLSCDFMWHKHKKCRPCSFSSSRACSCTSTPGSPGKLAKWVRLSIVRKKIVPAKSLLENVLNYQKIFLN